MNVENLNKYKDNCYSALSRDLTEFEKNFLFISAGLLAFSITFIKDIVKTSDARGLLLLFIAWLFIIVSIAIMMYTFLESAAVSDLLWKKADDFIDKHKLYDVTTILTDGQCTEIKRTINDVFYPKKKSLKRIRQFAVGSFLIGVIMFSVFVSINLLKENHHLLDQSSTKEISQGDTIIFKK